MKKSKKIDEPHHHSKLDRLGSLLYKMSAVLGVSAVILLVFMSRPLMSYFSRQLCYNMYPQASYWPNPLRGLWTSVSSVYTCEWMGHWGFNWHDVFSWLTNSWQVILSTLGSAGGFYALASKFAKNAKPNDSISHEDLQSLEANRREANALLNSLDENQWRQLFHAVKNGTLPMSSSNRSNATETRSSRAKTVPDLCNLKSNGVQKAKSGASTKAASMKKKVYKEAL